MSVVVIFFVVVAVIFFAVMGKKNNSPSLNKPSTPLAKQPPAPITAKNIMTAHEKTLFNIMRQALPECYIFPQVSFNAIISSNHQATRNKFNRKMTDYVITDQNFTILAIIELDDRSHDGREQQDAERDAMLKEAGYQVLHYRRMPDQQTLRNDIFG